MAERRESTAFQQAVPGVQSRSPAQVAAVIALAVIVAIIIGALYLAQATVTATTGSELIALQRTREFLQRANADTLAQIALRRNLTTLLGRAQALGFVPAGPDQLVYIVVQGYHPERATPTPHATAAPTYVYDETFTGWVQQQWNILVGQFEQWMGRNQPTPAP